MRGKILIVHDNNISKDDFIQKNELLTTSAKRNNITLAFKSNSELYTFIDNDMVKSHDSFHTYDYCLFFNKDMHLAKNLEMIGIKVVNNARAIEKCSNRAIMYQSLAKHNINIPKTVVMPDLNNFEDKAIQEYLTNAINDLALPIVVKSFFGTSGQSVYLARNKEQLFDYVTKLGKREIILQEYIVEASGSDIRMFVVKNKVIASIRRQGVQGDFRSNTNLGGTVTKYIPTYNDEQLALNAAKAMNCEFAIVDLLRSINGPVVCEVNSTANLNNFSTTCGIDIPEYLFKNIK